MARKYFKGQSGQNSEDRIKILHERMFPYTNSAAKLDSNKEALKSQRILDLEN